MIPISDTARQDIWRARNFQRLHSTIERVRKCGVVCTHKDGVSLSVAEDVSGKRKARFGNLHSCGSVWSCYRCSYVVARARGDELAMMIRAYRALTGGDVVFVTLTAAHKASDRLVDLWDGVTEAYRHVVNSRRFKNMRGELSPDGEGGYTSDGLVDGYIKATEATHGDHGWHPHLHLLFFVPDAWEFGRNFSAIRKLWIDGLAKQGMQASKEGQRFRTVSEERIDTLAHYVGKGAHAWGVEDEITGGMRKNGKHGRTPMEILHGLVHNEAEPGDLKLWHEWEQVSHGKRQLVHSRFGGIWSILGSEIRPDQEIAEQTGDELDQQEPRPDERVLGYIPSEIWSALLRHRRTAVLEMLEILELIDSSAEDEALEDFEYRLGVPIFSREELLANSS
ncbi:hypothetical protein [Tsukamurella strandjordii]|uniref:hypothetical protein n=1 Tax=Tsukamurella strandjordii TaxID=147577 RepID=UPI0031D7081D